MVVSKAVGPLLLVALVLSGCIFRTVSISQVGNPFPDSASFASPLKLQLRDGSLAVFPKGARLRADTLYGNGMRYSAALTDSTPVTWVHRDSIATAVRYRTQVAAGPTTAVNLFLVPAVVFAGIMGGFLIACYAGSACVD